MRSILVVLWALAFAAPALAVAPPRRAAGPDASAPRRPPAWLGVAMGEARDGAVLLEHVVRRGPAGVAGLRDGDRVTAIGAVRVSTPTELARAVSDHAPRESVAIHLVRDGAPRAITVVLGERPGAEEMARLDLVGEAAPELSRAVAVGRAPRSLAELQGRVVLIDFWASWCGPCRMVAPRLSALHERYGAEGLTVLGVTTDDAELAARAARALGMSYPTMVDTDGVVSRAYGISSLPTLVLVDRSGRVRHLHVGVDPSDTSTMAREIEALLAEPARARRD